MSEAAHVPEPRDSYELVGCEAAETAFLDALARGRLHHAWLLCGPRGVGKASFAYRAARRLLGAAPDAGRGLLGSDPNDPVCRRIEARAHADLTVLERPYDEKRERYRGVIPVDEARKLAAAFGATAGEGGWRVAIIDAADDLNANAANAILKTLEEPPERAVVFLVAHAPGLLPATVRSRCRRLAFPAPGLDAAAGVVSRVLGVKQDAAVAAAELSGGRPGEAVRLAAAGAADLAPRIRALLEALPMLDGEAAHQLAEELSGQDKEELRDFFFEALGAHALARARSGRGVEAWGALWERSRRLAIDLEALNLDSRLVILDALSAAREAAASQAA